jgi:hypothetical protein
MRQRQPAIYPRSVCMASSNVEIPERIVIVKTL